MPNQADRLRWLDSLRISWLDMKLGARMVRRYPGLTLVGGLAMGVAIAIGAGVMGVIALLKDPRIPLDEGERIVGIQVWNTSSYNALRMIGYDFLIWKAELTTVRDVGAFRNVTRAIGANDGSAEPARGAEMSASGFRVARVPPLLGRYLMDDDERPGAPLVAVLGHDIWSSRFGSDSTLVGKSVKIGGVDHTVVGVMPAGYAWPINHNLWVPLRLDPATKPREGPVLYAFGRLAPGVSLEEARAEVAAIGDRTAAQLPAMRGDVRPHLMAFAQSWFELDSPETVMVYQAARAAVTLLLIIICVNIAILVYARTATRQAEIAVRSALGASRTRIVAQLVGEALVLAALGGVVAIGLLSAVASQTDSIVQRTGASAVIPFWLKMGVSAETVAYLVLLAVFAALIVGVVPALQMTGRRVQANLQRLSGGHASVRMGKVWTALIVAEVAFTVAILPGAVFLSGESLKTLAGPGFPAERYLSAELGVNREPNETGADSGSRRFDERSTLLRDEVIRRILAEDNVRAVTYSAEIPGSESGSRIEIEGATAKFNVDTDGGKVQYGWGENSHQVRAADVDYGYFEAFQVQPIVGRTFRASDLLPGGGVAVVNRALADSLFPGGNPIGRRVRVLGYGDRGGEHRGAWLEVVGVVPSFPANVDFERPKLVMYTVVRHVQPALLSILMRDGNPSGFSSRLRTITSEVDQSMFLRNVQPLSETISATHLPLRLMTTGLLAVTLSVLILSSAGLYALMLVTVTQRRREIGIRMALGADRRQVLSGIFWRAALQVSGGIAIGITIAMAAHWGDIKTEEFEALVILPAVSLFMLGVGVLASMGPARRGLAIQPSVVLKEE
ncbi:MAG TPA: ABC transporter permease [Gemmatimonadaceae bacterium]|nr:ABC transporter permease [Gemmatimonadaceae bacterium]